MKIIITISAILVLTAGIVYNQVRDRFTVKENIKKVLSESSEEGQAVDDPDLYKTDEKSGSYEEKIIDTPTPLPTKKPTPQPTQTSDIDPDLNTFIYPGSKIISSASDFLSLEITDDTDAVTQWYKEKIGSLGMSVKSFVTTKTNNNILNKLVGAKSGSKVSVEITKEDGSNISKVSVVFETD